MMQNLTQVGNFPFQGLASSNKENKTFNTEALFLLLIRVKDNRASGRDLLQFKEELNALSIEALDELLSKLSYEIITTDSSKGLEAVLELIPKNKMEELLTHKGHSFDIETVAKELSGALKNLECVLDAETKSKIPSKLEQMFKFVLSFFRNVIDTFLIAFTLYDIGKDPQSAWEASAMLDIYYKFFMLPTLVFLVFKIIFPTITWPAVLLTSGTLLAIVTFLVLYVKYLRPCPDQLPHCEANFTKDVLEGKIRRIAGRGDEIERMLNQLSGSQKRLKKHILLVGDTGVGKTKLVQGLAERIESPHYNGPLKGKKIFQVSTSSLLQSTYYGYADQTKYLLNRAGDLNKVIFFFDEIHAAFKNDSNLSNFLKLILDKEDFLCIAATTDKEFKKYIAGDEFKEYLTKVETKGEVAGFAEDNGKMGKNSENSGDAAFLGRFEVIEVKPLEKEAVKEVLKEQAETYEPSLEVSEDALDEIISIVKLQPKKKSSPDAELSLFLKVASRAARVLEPNWCPRKVQQLKLKRESLLQACKKDFNLINPFSPSSLDFKKELEQVNEQIEKQQLELVKVQEWLKKFQNIQNVKKAYPFQIKKDVETVTAHKYKNETQNNRLFFDLLFLNPAMAKALEEVKEKLEPYSKYFDEEISPFITRETLNAFSN